MCNISFIVPAYNCGATIVESLDSIFSGNFFEGDEVIVVDDCSTDNTREILALVARNSRVVRLLNHSVNRGGGAARNTAVEQARNELIFCLDADNLLAPDSIRLLKRFMIENNADAAAFEQLWYFTNDRANITHTWHFNCGQMIVADCLAGHVNPISSGNYLYTRKSWASAGGYPEFANALDAWGFGFRQVATGHKLLVLEGSGYFHRYGHESYWVRESRKGVTSLSALQIIIPFLDQLDRRSINYAMGERGRYTWFESMEKKPIKTIARIKGRNGKVVRSDEHLKQPCKKWQLLERP